MNKVASGHLRDLMELVSIYLGNDRIIKTISWNGMYHNVGEKL